MAGLLYKDYAGIRGGRILLGILLATIVFLTFRVMLPGTSTSPLPGVFAEREDRMVVMTEGEFTDTLLFFLFFTFLMFCVTIIPAVARHVIQNDEKSKILYYIGAMPLNREKYFASKYLFIGITTYVLLSIFTIWCILFQAFAGENRAAELVEMLSSGSVALFGISLLICSLEMPFMLTCGAGKAKILIDVLLVAVLFAVVGFLLFGDLNALEEWLDILKIVEWIKAHPFWVILTDIMSPVAAVSIFGLSYKITCVINKDREVQIHE